jgi:hypothetical protein
VSEASE